MFLRYFVETERYEDPAAAANIKVTYLAINQRDTPPSHSPTDGFWEWNVTTGRVEFSTRWMQMVGHRNINIKHIDDWKALIHPDDREAMLARLASYVDLRTPFFEFECRVKNGDGIYRRLFSSATASRQLNANSWHISVIDHSVSADNSIEEKLIQAAESFASMHGGDFFRSLVRSLSTILGTRDNLVCYCIDEPPTRMRTLAYFSRGGFRNNFEYDLAGTTCAVVIESKASFYVPSGVGEKWPIEKQYDRDSYLGVPLLDSAGKIIGLFACMDGQPMHQDPPHLALFKIYAASAAAELERTLERQRSVAAERTRIMTDMHDGVGGQLISTLSLVESGDATLPQIAAALRDCIDDLRLAIDSLEPTESDLLPVLGNLRCRIEGRLKNQGIQLDWEVQDVPELPHLTPQNVLQVLRILQEAFTNVIKHAHASSVSISTGVEPAGRQVYIRIRDNGTGFIGNPCGRGLANMRRRAKTIGGEIKIDALPTGTTLNLLIPISASDPIGGLSAMPFHS